jgi:hypothetical protein
MTNSTIRTTRKNFNPIIKTYLLEVIESSEGMENTTEVEKVMHVNTRFMSEYAHEITLYGLQQAFINWLQGLALDVKYSYGDIEVLLLSWGVLTGNETEAAKGKALDQYWVRLASNMLQLINKHK